MQDYRKILNSVRSDKQGFTLIELMIVVAIIAILATLGVTNFSSAIRRARDSKRQSDIIAVQKALETCYDIRTGLYITDNNEAGVAIGDVTGDVAGWDALNNYLSADDKGCLNAPIVPANEEYAYTADMAVERGVQTFVLCADLENAGGNNSGVDAANSVACADDSAVDGGCNLFCVVNSQ